MDQGREVRWSDEVEGRPRRWLGRGRSLAAIVLASALAVACGDDSTGPDDGEAGVTVALPDTLFDGNGYIWDIQEDGWIENGSSDAYDGGFFITVDAAAFEGDTTALATQAGRELAIGPDTLAAVELTRRIYVPGDRAFARYLEVFVNRGAAAASVTVVITSGLGSDGATVNVLTSDLDGTYEAADRWIVTDDADGTVDPSLAHVIAGPGGTIPVASVTSNVDVRSETFVVPVPAGGRAILMHFASQNANRDAAIRSATALGALGVTGALAGMSAADLADVGNWDLTP